MAAQPLRHRRQFILQQQCPVCETRLIAFKIPNGKLHAGDYNVQCDALDCNYEAPDIYTLDGLETCFTISE